MAGGGLQGCVLLAAGAHGFEIVAAVGTAPELLDALINHRPDASIIDVRPPTPK